MAPPHGNYKTAGISRVNDGTSSDLSQLLATHPGWLLGGQAFSLSSVAPANLFVYDTTSAVTTASVPVWQAVIPFSGFLSGTTQTAAGGGFTTLIPALTLNNGLAYAISSASISSAMTTSPANLVKVNLQYVTSSCL